MKKFPDIDAMLEEVITLPSIPSTLSRITELLEDPNTSLAQVGKVISSDPGIAMKTMRLVNSAAYGLGREIVSIDHAVVMLGARVIKNLVITATTLETMRGSSLEFLRHCVACGVAMKTLSEQGVMKESVTSPDEGFVLGLFHDIGILLFSEFMPDHQTLVEKIAREEQIHWNIAEQRVLGVDHAALGGRLAEQWKLPQVFAQAISGHHDLGRCGPEYRVVAAGLAVADHLAHASGYSWHAGVPFGTTEEVWIRLGVHGEAVVAICDAFFKAVPTIDEYLSFAT